LDLVTTSAAVARAAGRVQKIELLAACLRRLGPSEVPVGVSYLSGELPQGRIGIGPAQVRRAIPATAAEKATLRLLDADSAFERMATRSGQGSTVERVRTFGTLLQNATHEEQSFLVRLALGELRQGALEGVVLEAVARAATVPAGIVRRAAMLAGDLRRAAAVALTEGEAGLARFSIHVLEPIRPMLAQTAGTLAEALSRIPMARLEFKLDGARVQVHRSGNDLKVFTRSLKDVTDSVPEVVETALRLAPRNFILDGEALALRGDGSPAPFQTTMRRFGRRLDVAVLRESLPLKPSFFDCLYLEGEALIDRPLAERAKALEEVVPAGALVPAAVTNDPDQAAAFLEKALGAGHEGVMAKAMDSLYEAGGRGHAWLKIKPAHTLDLVVLAADWGHGRRRGFLSNLHLGAKDPATGSWVMLGKTFKGMTDEMLARQTQELQALETSRDRFTVYVRPELVVEVAFDELQRSPRYGGGMALRLARVKGYRPDKDPTDADTMDRVREVFEMRRPPPKEGPS
jgi:DNA ligase-1